MATLGSMRDVIGSEWTNLKGWSQAVAVYDDGPRSVWPPEAVAYFEAQGVPIGHITVLGNPASLIFDVETGNASMAAQADGMAERYRAGLPSVWYCNGSTFGGGVAELAVRQLPLLGAERWPAPGVYVWAADWTQPAVAHSHASWCTVQEVAVQWGSFPGYDVSETVGTFPDTTIPLPEEAPVTDADVIKITQAVRALFQPGQELFDRVVQATIQAIKETGASIEADDQAAIDSRVLRPEPASAAPVTPS